VFLRTTARYQEVLEAYRHPATGRPTNRCLARWPIRKTLEAYIAALSRQRLRLQREGRETEKLDKKLGALRDVRKRLRKSGHSAKPASSYLVLFDGDGTALTDRARQVIREAAESLTKMLDVRIEVSGYSNARVNLMVALHRARAVQADLVKNGVAENAISIQVFGGRPQETRNHVEITARSIPNPLRQSIILRPGVPLAARRL
jgi:outer membrane protein OmpA-like peptidoglycan-associated protein